MINYIQKLNGNFRIHYDFENSGVKQGFPDVNFDKSIWKQVFVPLFWFDRDYDGVTWFARNFQINENLSEKNLAIFFRYVDDQAEVYLNGEKIYYHNGNDVTFGIDISTFISKKEKNHLVIKVTDTGGSGRIIGDIYLKNFENLSEIQPIKYNSQKALKPPVWLKDAVIYELYIRSFSDEQGFKGITKKLSSLKQLGINCIWLMPIFPVGNIFKKGTFGCPYAIADYKNVNPEFGTGIDFYTLVQQAHRLDIRIILDIAINHSSWDNKLIKNNPDWYSRDMRENIIHPYGTDWTDVADLNYENDELQEYMWDVLKYWVEEFDIDGYRCDVAELVPLNFWRKATKKLQKIKPDILMLAEGSYPELYLNGFQLSYGWDTRATLHKILNLNVSASRLNLSLEKEIHQYPQNAQFMRFIENHDLKRAAEYFGVKGSKLAAVLAFTIPGVPMIYAGQEVGEEQTPSLFEKETIHWESDEHNLWKFYQALLCIRKRYISLRTGEYMNLPNNCPDSILSITRKGKYEAAIIIANISSERKEVAIDLKDVFKERMNWERVFGESDYQLNKNSIRLSLARYEYLILIYETKKMRY